jgi:hypothetical protein
MSYKHLAALRPGHDLSLEIYRQDTRLTLDKLVQVPSSKH